MCLVINSVVVNRGSYNPFGIGSATYYRVADGAGVTAGASGCIATGGYAYCEPTQTAVSAGRPRFRVSCCPIVAPAARHDLAE